MAYIGYILEIMLGVFLIWMGSLQLIGAMLPHNIAMKMADAHGAWIRENIFHLPEEKSHDAGTEG